MLYARYEGDTQAHTHTAAQTQIDAHIPAKPKNAVTNEAFHAHYLNDKRIIDTAVRAKRQHKMANANGHTDDDNDDDNVNEKYII